MTDDNMGIIPAGVCGVARDKKAVDGSWPSGLRHLLCRFSECPGPIDADKKMICGLWWRNIGEL